jgi:CHAT domain-containing protein
MSLWKVPDEETRKLMEDFYRRVLNEQPGQSIAEALRSAQLAMKETEEYRDPLYWGAFIYEGDPGFAS